MKAIFCSLLMCCLLPAASFASNNYDGCYQLYMPGSMYPSFCLEGTLEEGISGSGVRLVIFDTNTVLISACAVSSSLEGSGNSLEFILGNKKELIMSDVKLIQSRLEGTATFGKTSLKFIQISESESKRLLSIFYSEAKCQQLNNGEIVKLIDN